MKLKKFIAILCSAAMAISIITLPAAAADTTPIKGYIANDTFDDGTTGGWVEGAHGELTFAEGATPSDTLSVVTNPTIGGEIYNGSVLKIASNGTNVNDSSSGVQLSAYRDVNDVEFTGSNKIIIKTKVYQEAVNSASTGRFDLRFNRPNVHPQLSGLNDHQWLQYGVFRQQNNWAAVVSSFGHRTIGQNYVNSISINNMMPANKWVEYTIELDGVAKTTKITAVIDGTSYTATGLLDLAPAIYEDIYGDGVNPADCYVKALESFTFKNTSPEAVYIDYFKVWQEGVKITDAISEADLKNIKVKLTSNGALLDGVADYLKLYESDGVTEANVTKSYDMDTKTITFTSQTDFPAGNIYKVKVDKTGLFTDMLYTWEAPEEINVEAPACVAVNPKIKGKLIPGTELEADYGLMPEGAQEGASVFQWYTVAPDGTKTVIDGRSEKTFAVTSDYIDSTITYSVIPKCVVDGVEKTGLVTNCSEVAKPLSVPVITNPGYVQSSAMIDYDLEAKYDYTDADGDEEAGSVITWYAGSSAASNDYDDFAIGKSIKLTNELNGKYIKYSVQPKNNADFREAGDIVWSEPIGPVSDALTASNMLTNADLESGEITPWFAGTADGYNGVEITDADAHSGVYSILAHPRMNVLNGWGQNVELEAGKMYIISSMIKSATEDSYKGYEGHISSNSVAVYRPFRDDEFTSVSSDEWTRVTLTFYVVESGTYRCGFKSDSALESTVYVDDAYMSELMISDIKTRELAPLTVPQGDEKVTVNVLELDVDGNPIVYNQLGEQDGLTTQKATVSVTEYPGVTVVGNQVVIDSSAVAGTVNIQVKCVPDYTCTDGTNTYNPVPAQTEFVKTVALELVPHTNTAPEARNVDATGTVITGNTLYGSYDFYQVEGRENASTVRWLYSDTENGTYTAIPGATGMSYLVNAAYADKFIKFEVTPKTVDGLKGTPVTSVTLTKPTAPVAKNITISGDFKVGGTVTGTYKFEDYNRDDENKALTTFKWYVADTEYGQYNEIQGQTGASLILGEELIDKYIKFSVIPVAETEPYTGAETFSNPVLGPVAPVAKNVSITAEGNILIGNYTYYHPYNARELEPIYRWSVDGVPVSDDASYIVNFSGRKTVTFTVTPVGDTNPGTGKSVSVSVVMNGVQGTPGGNTSAGGFGGGGASGGGGGGAIAGGVTSINDKNYAQETEPEKDENKPSVSDLDGHWGEEYIKKMEARSVMSADEHGSYKPDELVSREDMLTYLFKTLKLEKSEYSGMFSDVADGEFAGMLQTMVDNGTISVDTTFRPGDSISREEMCKILYISLENAGKLKAVDDGLISGHSDYSEVSDWAVKYVNAIYGIKMMIGVSEDRFAPKENVTKAQAATMLVRIISWVEGE